MFNGLKRKEEMIERLSKIYVLKEVAKYIKKQTNISDDYDQVHEEMKKLYKKRDDLRKEILMTIKPMIFVNDIKKRELVDESLQLVNEASHVVGAFVKEEVVGFSFANKLISGANFNEITGFDISDIDFDDAVKWALENDYISKLLYMGRIKSEEIFNEEKRDGYKIVKKDSEAAQKILKNQIEAEWKILKSILDVYNNIVKEEKGKTMFCQAYEVVGKEIEDLLNLPKADALLEDIMKDSSVSGNIKEMADKIVNNYKNIRKI